MKAIAIVLWLCLWPVTWEVMLTLTAHRNTITKREHLSRETEFGLSKFMFAIYVFVTLILLLL